MEDGYKMEKRKFRAILILLAVLLIIILLFEPSVVAEGNGPALNSGDGVPNEGRLDAPFGSLNGRGPAPSSGDGDSEGPGWE